MINVNIKIVIKGIKKADIPSLSQIDISVTVIEVLLIAILAPSSGNQMEFIAKVQIVKVIALHGIPKIIDAIVCFEKNRGMGFPAHAIDSFTRSLRSIFASVSGCNILILHYKIKAYVGNWAWFVFGVIVRGFVFLGWMCSAGFENGGLLKNLKHLRLIEIL